VTQPTDQARREGGEELADPDAYQRRLVGLVGYDDPAAVQGTTGAAWRALVAEAGPDLRTRPSSDEWSVLECLGHAVDGELVMSGRYRWALAEDDPEIVGYDQDQWVAALDHGRADPEDLLRLFDALRASNLAIWKASTPDERARTVRHRERGPESLGLMFTMIAGHDRFHLAQARRALTAVRAG
jgi:DinB superfamily